MNIRSLLKVLLPLFLSLELSGLSSTLCVAPSASGRADGSDWNNTLSSSFTPVRGNTYYLADGAYGAKTFGTAASGNSLITIKKATVAEHGTDTGWSSGLGDGLAVFDGLLFTTAYWDFDGVTGTFKGDRGFYVSRTTKGFAVEIQDGNVVIQNVKISWPDKNDPNMILSGGVEVKFYTGVGDGYRAMTNVTLRNVYFSEIPGYPMRFIKVAFAVVEHCVVNGMTSTVAEHASGIIFRNSSCNDGIIRWNWFERLEGTGGITFYDVPHSRWQIYGNVFRQVNCGQGIVTVNVHPATPAASLNDAVIANNTMDNLGSAANMGITRIYPPSSNNIVMNNLWYRCAWVVADAFSPASWNYNMYIDCKMPYSFIAGANDTPVREGGDGKYAVLTASPFFDVGATNYHLTSAMTNYPGMDLGSAYLLDSDGITRGRDGTWKRGAYESIGGPASPSRLRTPIAPKP